MLENLKWSKTQKMFWGKMQYRFVHSVKKMHHNFRDFLRVGGKALKSMFDFMQQHQQTHTKLRRADSRHRKVWEVRVEKVNTWLLTSTFVGRLGTHVKQITTQQHWFCPEFILAIKSEKEVLIRTSEWLRARLYYPQGEKIKHHGIELQSPRGSRFHNAMITTAAS